MRVAEILDAAKDVFLEKGYERALVSEIAGRVGVVEGNVFRYFPTKRDLLNAVLLSLYEPLIADVESGFSRISGLRGRIRFIVWRHIRVYTETPGLARLVLHEIRSAPDYRMSVLHDLQLQYTGYLRQTLEQAVSKEEVSSDIDYAMARAMLYGGLEHMMWPVLHGRHQVDVEEVADRFTEVFLRGIGANADRSALEIRIQRLERLVVAGASEVAPRPSARKPPASRTARRGRDA